MSTVSRQHKEPEGCKVLTRAIAHGMSRRGRTTEGLSVSPWILLISASRESGDGSRSAGLRICSPPGKLIST